MATLYETLSPVLMPPVNRQTIIELLSLGQSLPPMVKSIAFIAINTMRQSELDNLGNKALEIITLMDNNDLEGLRSALSGNGLPAPIIEVILTYAENNIK